MKLVSLITLMLVSTLTYADQCKPVDTYFDNVEHIKHCVMVVMNDMDGNKRKLFKTQPDCTSTVKRVDKNRAEIEGMDQVKAQHCFLQRSVELTQTKQIYLIFNSLR